MRVANLTAGTCYLENILLRTLDFQPCRLRQHATGPDVVRDQALVLRTWVRRRRHEAVPADFIGAGGEMSPECAMLMMPVAEP